MTPPSRTRSEHPLLIRRRDFLKKATGAVAVFSLGGLSACGDDDFDGPSAKGFEVWIAQRVYGVVWRDTTNDPIPGASVELRMGFDPDPDKQYRFASMSTDSQGKYDMAAWDEGDDLFWTLLREDELPVLIYITLKVRHENHWPEDLTIPFTRTPSKDQPIRRLDIYTHNINVAMHRRIEQ